MMERNYKLVLLLAVGAMSALFTAAVGGFEPAARQARQTVRSEARAVELEPVRIVGTPFVPNVRPSER